MNRSRAATEIAEERMAAADVRGPIEPIEQFQPRFGRPAVLDGAQAHGEVDRVFGSGCVLQQRNQPVDDARRSQPDEQIGQVAIDEVILRREVGVEGRDQLLARAALQRLEPHDAERGDAQIVELLLERQFGEADRGERVDPRLLLAGVSRPREGGEGVQLRVDVRLGQGLGSPFGEWLMFQRRAGDVLDEPIGTSQVRPNLLDRVGAGGAIQLLQRTAQRVGFGGRQRRGAAAENSLRIVRGDDFRLAASRR